MKAICNRKAGGVETYGVSHVRRDQHEGHLPQEGCGERETDVVSHVRRDQHEGHLPQEGWGREKHTGLVMYAVISMKAICHRKAAGGETYGVSHVRHDQHEGHLQQEGWGSRNIRG